MTHKGGKIYNVAVYCRLSKDDGTELESQSINTQKQILIDYVKQNGWRVADIYVDDGFSGINFDRPNFQRMIKDIEAGLIDCVITKDLSRLGRNYLDCGLYLEVFFPEHNVRYIAVNDGVDTLNKSAMDITPFRNILNEMYSADVSVKVKTARRARFKQGKFMGTSAPYGYIKDPNDNNHLIIDEKAAPVVKMMFELAKGGMGIGKIRKHLTEQHILRPAAMAVENGANYERYFENKPENRYVWSNNSVRAILRSPVYAGHVSGYKRPIPSMKSKKRLSAKPEEWEYIMNTHEAIVSQADFDLVQRLMTSRRKEYVGSFENHFSGIVKCADCGYAMRAQKARRAKQPDEIDNYLYCCNHYAVNGNTVCTQHVIEARDLFDAVLNDINLHARMAVENDAKMVLTLQNRLNTISSTALKSSQKEQKRLQKRLNEIDKLFSALYEDKVMEKITERNFDLMSRKYEMEQLEIEHQLSQVEIVLQEKMHNDSSIRDFVQLVKSFDGITELNATILNALIEKITVSERTKNNAGEMEQKITIYYRFVGSLDDSFVYQTKKEPAPLAERVCSHCGEAYVPGSGAAKYCKACSKIVRREKANANKQKHREEARKKPDEKAA
ncbi:recombinase family protein [Eubacteriales bacterium OttesenSCG-928-K08]|nr:recombinase family protein [Eubacteriales bacterium OttesenSCG-928-K08]